MAPKPSYEELAQRILELEKVISEERSEIGTLLGNRRFLEDLIEHSGALIVIKDRDGTNRLVNRKWEASTGLTREFVLGKTDDKVFPPHIARQFHENDLRVLKHGAILEAEEVLDSPSGKRFFISNKFPLIDDEGAIAGLCGIITDITDRKRAEEALRESENKYQSLFNNAQVALFRTSVDGKLIEINQRYAEMAGYSSVEDCLAEFSPAKAWVDPGARSEMVRIIRETGCVKDYEAHILRKDGTPIWILFSATFFPELGFIEGSIIDISDRKRMEQALRDSEARFKALHNASFGGITIHDKGIILDCNQGLSDISGYSMAELVGMNGLLLISEKTRDLVLKNILEGYEKPYEAIGLRKDGTEYPLRLEARNIPYKERMVRVVEFRDITESKRAEQERHKLQEQLTQAQKMESVGRLAGGVAHDYNNMLSVILGYTELALDKVALADPLHADLTEIFKAAKRSSEITRQLLAFARKQTIAPKVVDLNAIVGSMFRMIQRLIGEDIDIVWRPEGRLWPVKIDPSQVEQVLANLCVNARDAIAGVGKVTIETHTVTFDEAYCADHSDSEPGDFVLLAVSDDGCGMDKGTIDSIFEPFFTTKDVDEGTGLGLATVYGIVKQNNGFINVYSEPGRGTTFRIYLPRHVGATETITADRSEAVPQSHGERILLVEDEPAIRKMSQKMLERMGYHVFAAGTPEDALRLAREHQGDIRLLITDVVMPGMNGRDLADQLHDLYPHMKILFMSGYTANVIAHRGVLEEEVQFIQKPFSMKELGVKVRVALEDI